MRSTGWLALSLTLTVLLGAAPPSGGMAPQTSMAGPTATGGGSADGGAADDSWMRVELGPVTVQVPVAWQRRTRNGSNRFDAPKGNAYFTIDTGTVLTQGMEPSVCLDKILAQLGTDEGPWHKLVLGGFPAAHRSVVDVAKGGATTVRTHSFVGCDGSTTYSILFSLDDKHADDYEKQVVSLAKSLEFTSHSSGGRPSP